MLNFEWDKMKAKINLSKHIVSFEEATTVFDDVFAKYSFDPDYSSTEDRYVIVGCSFKNRILFMSYTDRNDKIRIISSRLASNNERKYYENAK